MLRYILQVSRTLCVLLYTTSRTIWQFFVSSVAKTDVGVIVHLCYIRVRSPLYKVLPFLVIVVVPKPRRNSALCLRLKEAGG